MNLPELPENQRWRVHRDFGYLTVQLQQKSLITKDKWSKVEEKILDSSTAYEAEIERVARNILFQIEEEARTKSLLGIYPPGRE